MRAQLKRIHSPDVQDLSACVPEVRDRFGFLLQMMVGPKGSEGEESFDLCVCTRERLPGPIDQTPSPPYQVVRGDGPRIIRSAG
jgi:hypothetical protein